MLPAAHRMRRSSEFSSVVRGGDRAGSSTLVAHVRAGLRAPDEPPVVGFVVSKAVGGSVVRHRVSRRLRAVLAERVATLPAGSATVIRALPPAARARSADLAADVDRSLARALTRSRRRAVDVVRAVEAVEAVEGTS